MTTNMTVFDKEAALHRLEGDLDLLRELAEIFREETPRLTTTLGAALAANDILAAQRAAHAIKGSAANLGAVALCEQAKRIELMARAGDLGEADAAYASLRVDLERFEAVLAELD